MKNRNSENRRSVKILNWFSVFFLLVGILGFMASPFCTFFTDPDDPKVSSWLRFPLGDPASLAVDSEGNLYCGLIPYCRIQVYSPEGKFIRGWFVDNGGRRFQIKIDEEDKLHVHTVSGNRYFIFSKEGKLRHKEIPWSGERSSLGSFSQNDYKGNDGNIYKIRSQVFFLSKVVKTDANGNESVVLSDPFFLCLVNAPFPVLFWGFLGAFLYMIKYYLENMEEIKRRNNLFWETSG